MILRPAALAALTTTLALSGPAVAGAHVTVQPTTAAAGAYVVENVRVPNEKDDKATTKVQLQLPDGFTSASYEPVTGWKVTVERAKFAKPIQTEDGEVTEGVKQITWTAQDGGGIEPGQFIDFPISVRVPGTEGDKLTFKALQTYEGGEVVRWIGAPDADKPAPVLEVTAAQGGHGAADDAKKEQGSEQAAVAEETRTTTSTTAAPVVVEDDEDSDTLAIVALIVGGLGLAAGGLALITGRRRATA